MDPEEIRRQANALRKEEKKAKEAELKARKPKEKIWVPPGADSWKVFRVIRPKGMRMMLWIYFVLSIGIVFFAIYFLDGDQWALYPGFGFLALFTARFLIDRFFLFREFTHYKNWRSDLGFPVNGWEKLGCSRDFPRVQYWEDKAVFTVVLKENPNEEGARLVTDALLLFMKEANSGFYEEGIGEPSRDEWKFAGKKSVSGAADPWVLGEIYWCIDRMLRGIHKKYRVIQSVELEFSGEVYYVEAKDTSIG